MKISLVTNKNFLEIVLKVIRIDGPREDSTRIASGDTVKKSTADASPLRRINIERIYLVTLDEREALSKLQKY